jgi:hypothetical protein
MLITLFTKVPAILVAGAMPVVATCFAFVDLALFVPHTSSNSTAPIIIPVAFFFGLIGGVPGVLAGLTVSQLTKVLKSK